MAPLTIAVGNYGLTKALKDGSLKSDRLELAPVEIAPITAAMRRMVRGLEFDICEMAFTTYLCAKSFGKKVTAIPVFVTRNFHHWAVWHNVKAGIRTPKDLEGRTVGVNRGYTVTTGLWVRGVLQDQYGVDLKKIRWAATDDEHVAEYRAPSYVDYDTLRGKDLGALLAAGEIDAAIGDIKADSADVKQLIPDAPAAGFAYFRKTGIYPLNHTVVVKDALLAAQPRLAEELFHLFKTAKETWRAKLAAGTDLTAADKTALALQAGIGGDPFPYGIEPNRKALEAVARFCVDQDVIAKPYRPEDMFAESTRHLAG
jgi:4,5-dihydroxyphthalate decarboxylase